MFYLLMSMLLFLGGPLRAAESAPTTFSTNKLATNKLSTTASTPAATVSALPAAPLASQLQDVKNQVMQLNRDLFLLEEDLLFPASTQLGIYLSMDAGILMPLDAIELRLNGDKIGGHLYTPQQTQAIQRGALQRVYAGNIKSGEHTLTVVLTGRFVPGLGAQDQAYRRAIEYKFKKETDPVWLEIKVIDDTNSQQPALEVKAWPSTL
jgi:hypothetical protein